MSERAAVLRAEMQKVMMEDVGVFRTAPGMQAALTRIRELKERFGNLAIDDKGKQLKRVAEAMSERTFAAGEEITKEGEVGVGFFVIEEGRARVTMNELTVGELGPGDHFGEISLIAETPRAATVTAETAMRCQGMTSWDFRKLVEGNGEIAWATASPRKLSSTIWPCCSIPYASNGLVGSARYR